MCYNTIIGDCPGAGGLFLRTTRERRAAAVAVRQGDQGKGGMTVKRDKNGRFAKGNPGGGRRKMPPEFREAVLKYAPDALSVVAGIMRDPKAEPQHRLAAAKLVIEYAYGKPRQAVELEGGAVEICVSVEDDGG